MKPNLPAMVLFSAELSTLGARENLYRTIELAEWLDESGVPYSKCVGVYKGVRETSFAILAKNFSLNLRRVIFSTFEQESILYLDEDRNASLQFGDFAWQRLGKWTGVHEAAARKRDHTYCWDTDTHYVIGGAV